MAARSSAADYFARLQAIDAALASEAGLSIKAAAAQWQVDRNTIFRDLKNLAELGRTSSLHRTNFGPGGGPVFHRYDPGIPPLFNHQPGPESVSA